MPSSARLWASPIDRAEVLGAEPRKTLFCDRGAHFLNRIEMGDLGKISFFSESTTNSVRSSASKQLRMSWRRSRRNLIDVCRGEDLCADPFDVSAFPALSAGSLTPGSGALGCITLSPTG